MTYKSYRLLSLDISYLMIATNRKIKPKEILEDLRSMRLSPRNDKNL